MSSEDNTFGVSTVKAFISFWIIFNLLLFGCLAILFGVGVLTSAKGESEGDCVLIDGLSFDYECNCNPLSLATSVADLLRLDWKCC